MGEGSGGWLVVRFDGRERILRVGKILSKYYYSFLKCFRVIGDIIIFKFIFIV